MAWWTIILIVGEVLVGSKSRALKPVLDLLRLASDMNARVSKARSRFFASIDGKTVPPEQLWDDVERLLCQEALPLACQEIDDGMPALEVCAPAIIAAGCVIADGFGLKGAKGNALTTSEVAFLLCFGHPDASAWRIVLGGFETLIPASFSRGRDALAFFQKTSKRLLSQMRTFANSQTPAQPPARKAGVPPPPAVAGDTGAPPTSRGAGSSDPDPMEALRKQVENDRITIEQGGRLLLDEQDRITERLFAQVSGNDGLYNRIHLIQGIAGSGKTVLLGALVPRVAANFAAASNRVPKILIYHRNNYLRKPLEKDIGRMIAEHVKANGGPRLVFSVCHIWDLHKDLVKDLGFAAAKGELHKLKPPEIALHLIRERGRQANPQAIYDLIFVDEGQDICEEEYVLLRKLVEGGERFGIFVFFDDFQNLFRAGYKTVPERLSNLGELDCHALGVCVRSSKSILDFALNATLGPKCDEEDRESIEEALGIGPLLRNGGLIADPNRSWPVALYSCELCVFKGGRIAVVTADKGEALHTKIAETLRLFANTTGGQNTFPWSCLVLCLNNKLLDEVFRAAQVSLGKDFDLVLRSNVPSIKAIKEWLPKKTTEIAVRGKIAFANVHDAKGNDADVVLVIEPDDFGAAGALEKRALFYVAATRAKEHLIVLGVAGANRSTPILEDAAATANVLAQRELSN